MQLRFGAVPGDGVSTPRWLRFIWAVNKEEPGVIGSPTSIEELRDCTVEHYLDFAVHIPNDERAEVVIYGQTAKGERYIQRYIDGSLKLAGNPIRGRVLY